MLVENKKIEKVCSFYVSDFHLEMMLLPYITEKLNKNEEVIINTQKDLLESTNLVVSRMNLKEEEKNKILSLDWNRKSTVEKVKENSNIVLIGTEKYIENMNNKISDMKVNNIKIMDCYDFEEVQEKIKDIINNYDKSFNTLGIKKI